MSLLLQRTQNLPGAEAGPTSGVPASVPSSVKTSWGQRDRRGHGTGNWPQQRWPQGFDTQGTMQVHQQGLSLGESPTVALSSGGGTRDASGTASPSLPGLASLWVSGEGPKGRALSFREREGAAAPLASPLPCLWVSGEGKGGQGAAAAAEAPAQGSPRGLLRCALPLPSPFAPSSRALVPVSTLHAAAPAAGPAASGPGAGVGMPLVAAGREAGEEGEEEGAREALQGALWGL